MSTEAPGMDDEVVENPRSSSRERQPTERGLQYRIDICERNFKSSVSRWRKCVSTMTKALSDETDTSVIRDCRSQLEHAHKGVESTFFELVNLDKSDQQSITCVTAIFENLEIDFQNLMCKVADRLVELQADNLERRSRVSMRSGRSGCSTTSKSSSHSSKARAAVEAATLKAKLKYMEAENKAKYEWEKLVTMRNLEIAQAKVEHFDESLFDENGGADHGDLKLGIPAFSKHDMIKTYVNTQSLTGNVGKVHDENTSPKRLDEVALPESDVRLRSQDPLPEAQVNASSVLNPTAVPFNPNTTQSVGADSNVPSSNTTEDGIIGLAKSLSEQLSLSRLPPPEPSIFDGDPLKYPGWKSAFHVLIEKRNVPPNERIHYLRKYLSERVRDVVANFFLLGTEDAYADAKSLLDERYGDSFTVANAFRTKLDNWPKIQPKDSKGLQRFSDFLKQCHTAMSSIGSLGALDDDRENRKLLAKLPEWLTARWNRFAVKWKEEKKAFPPFKEFMLFVSREAKIACDPITSVHSIKSAPFHVSDERNVSNRKVGTFLSGTEGIQSKDKISKVKPQVCSYCQRAHDIDVCRGFLAKSVEDRKSYVRQKGWCFGCLENGHVARRCPKRRKCTKCEQMHPTSLHGDLQKAVGDPKGNSDKAEVLKTEVAGTSFMSSGGSCQISSLIVPVYVSHESCPDRELLVYALLDSQSDTTFVQENTCAALGLSGVQVNLLLSTMYAENKLVSSRKIHGLKVRGVNDSVEISLPDAYTRQAIPANREHIPTREMAEKWPHLHPIRNELTTLLDCEVGLLIGYNCSRALVPRAVIAPEVNGPFAQRTDLGWGIVGIVDQDGHEDDSDPIGVSHRVVVCEVDSSVGASACAGSEKTVKEKVVLSFKNRVKEVFSPSDVVQMMNLEFCERKGEVCISAEDMRFLDIVRKGIQRKDGHYEMPLPLKDGGVLFPVNKCQAFQRLMQLKRRLKGDNVFRDHYCSFMRSMIERGHAERVPKDDLDRNDGKVFYIPHHGVYNPKKPNKIRVVFDCSAQYQGASLNNHLLQGPDLTNKLVGVLCRFRKERVAVLCDIEQMFFQFMVSPDKRDLLRFLWWDTDDFDSEPIEFRMCVHLFGATSSPGCANFGLKQIATDFEGEFGTDAANFVRRDFYVDDGITSRPSESEAMDLIVQTRNMLAKGGLRLHKFLSSSKSLLQKIPPDDRAKGFEQVDLFADSLPIERALGAQWSIESDRFQFRVILSEKPFTRRGILSTVNSVYDPLGFICPVILAGKQILQQLCADQVDWDEPIPEVLRSKWEIWRNDLFKLSSMEVDRCFKPKDFGRVVTMELHNFSDASQSGYGQCSYLRLVDENRQVHCSLVMGKSRVVPLKPVTIPRLELTAALVSVKIGVLVQEELDLMDLQSWYWTDSKVVLGYISNEARRFHVYVANRVQQIREHTSTTQWNHVETEQNPADIASRGATVDELIKERQWINGPEFLWEPELPPRKELPKLSLEDCEIKKAQTHASHAIVQRRFDILDNLAYFSSWSHLKRALAVCHDYVKILRRRVRERSNSVDHGNDSSVGVRKVEDLIQSELLIVKSVQSAAFGEEIEVLRNVQYAVGDSNHAKSLKCDLKKTSPLARLDPFLDSDGVLRVGGRLVRSKLNEGVKNPVILPKKGHVVDLIVRHFHEKINHQGRGMTSNEIRAHGFWIIGLSSAVYRIVSKCTMCRRLRSATQSQKMSDLPVDRLEAVPPFTYCAVDYFGPWTIREGRKDLKRYGVLFTCLGCRAIHVEVASSLSTDSFINALRRFLSIRGSIRELRSDRGTNFVGAENEFKNAFSEMDHSKVTQFLLEKGCDNFLFNMNPPHASHMGGVWERQIRSVRNILSVLLYQHGSQLDEESLRTFMCEAAAIVNSRPLSTQNLNDPLSLEPLTPNHLLTMKSKVVHPPPGQFGKADLYSRKRWRRIQYMANEFWSRWRHEYLQNLQVRQKWERSSRNCKVGDVVLLKDEGLPRNQWSLARVVEADSDKDGFVRKVKIAVGIRSLDAKGRRNDDFSYLDRPVHKLVLLCEAE